MHHVPAAGHICRDNRLTARGRLQKRPWNTFATVGRQADNMRLSKYLAHIVMPPEKLYRPFLLPSTQLLGRNRSGISGIALADQSKSRRRPALSQHPRRFDEFNDAFVKQQPRRQDDKRRSGRFRTRSKGVGIDPATGHDDNTICRSTRRESPHLLVVMVFENDAAIGCVEQKAKCRYHAGTDNGAPAIAAKQTDIRFPASR